MLKISFTLSNFELISKTLTQSRTVSTFIDLVQNDLNKEKNEKK